MRFAFRFSLLFFGGVLFAVGGLTSAQAPDKARAGPSPRTDLAHIGPNDRILPINLGSALQLAGARPLDIDIAVQRTQIAAAELDRAKTLWLPTLYVGIDYF